jgi:hypothetical protein
MSFWITIHKQQPTCRCEQHVSIWITSQSKKKLLASLCSTNIKISPFPKAKGLAERKLIQTPTSFFILKSEVLYLKIKHKILWLKNTFLLPMVLTFCMHFHSWILKAAKTS